MTDALITLAGTVLAVVLFTHWPREDRETRLLRSLGAVDVRRWLP